MLLKQPLIFLSFLVLCVLQGFGQRNYFVYIQTETQESFYVLLNKKNYSSSSAGHVIISGLTNGTHAIEVGFPGQSATLDYQLVISNGDQGFLLRKMEDANTWGLVNMHTTQVQMSGVARREAAEAERQKALAAAAPAVAKAEEPAKAKVETEMKEDVLQQQVKEKEKEVAAVVTEATVALPVKADSVAKLPEPQKIAEPEKASTERRAKEAAEGPVQIKAAPEVAKPAASEAASGPLTPAEIARLQAEARKIDARGKRDSVLRAQKGQPSSTNSQPAFLDIDFTMPADSNVAKAEKPKEVVERAEEIKIAEPEKKMAEDTLVARAVKGEEVKAADPVKEVKAADPVKEVEVKAADPVKEVEVKATDPVKEAVVVPVVKGEPEKKDSAEKPAEGTTTATSKNPICLAETTASDLELVTMLMKAEKQADDALEIARKSMRVKCLNTIQVRELAKLFPEEEDRYRLLDMAYRYTTDRQNYAYLSDLLKDPYFVNRFKAMVQ